MNVETLGSKIRDRRKLLRISQRALAEISGVSVHTISDIESGKGNPTVALLQQLLEPIGLQLTVSLRVP